MLRSAALCALMIITLPLWAQSEKSGEQSGEKISISATHDFAPKLEAQLPNLSFTAEIDYLVERKKPKYKNKAYNGAVHKSGKNYIDPKWLDKSIKEIVSEFKKKYRGQSEEEFFQKLKYSPKKTHMLFYLKGFFSELSSAYAEDKNITKNEKLSETLRQKYLRNVGIYLAKKRHQQKAANPYKLPGFILNENQPLLATFIYGNPFIALAEVYKSSTQYNRKTQEFYRGIFKKNNLLIVMRRSYKIPVDQRYPVESLVKLTPEQMHTYTSFHILTWIEEEKIYRLSKDIEAAIK